MNMNMVNAPLNTKESFFGSLQPPIEVFFFPVAVIICLRVNKQECGTHSFANQTKIISENETYCTRFSAKTLKY